MKKNLQITLAILFSLLSVEVFGQCPTQAGAILSFTDVTCFDDRDGTITVELTDGTEPYNFELYDLLANSFVTLSVTRTVDPANRVVFSNVPPSAYKVVVFKLGCTSLELSNGSSGIVINQPNLLEVDGTSTPTSCNTGGDGTITASASGGNGTNEFSLNGGAFQSDPVFTGLSAGSHTLTVRDAKGCNASTSVEVTQPTPLTAFTIATDVTCNGLSDGTITVTAEGGTPTYEYSLDGLTYQASEEFTGLAAGSYTIHIRDANGCPTTTTATIGQPDILEATAVANDAQCNGASDGRITVTPTGGTELYQYSLDGLTFQASNIFEDLPAGDYTITVEDANGCTTTVDATVGEPTVLTASAVATDAMCNGSADGTITVSAGGGTLNYEYSLDGITFQPGSLFEDLLAGNYTITVRDANLCTVTTTAEVAEPIAIVATAVPTPITCAGANNGTIAVSASEGTPGYEYSIDGGTTYQPEDEFTGLAPGTYTITVRDANGCTVETAPVEIGEPVVLSAFNIATDVTCNGLSDGTITVTAEGGTPTYEYSLDDLTYQASAEFTGLAVGSYTIHIRDANDCKTTTTTTIGQPDLLEATAVANDAQCNRASDGIITVTPTGGTELYQYSLDGVTFQASNVFEDLVAGDYTITVEDANGCTTTVDATIGEPTVLTASALAADALCNGSANGTITASAEGGTLDYEYSLDGTTFQPGNLFENLVAGSYTITIRDANLCTVTTTAEVGEPVAIEATAVPTPITCAGANNGSIKVSATNGTPGYDYSIDGGTTYQPEDEFTGLAPGTYTITVRDANQCTVETAPIEIEEPVVLTAFNIATDVTCNGLSDGTITVTAEGGTPLYEYSLDGLTYQASEEFTGLAAGSYTIHIRDANGCPTTTTATIGQPDILEATAVANDAQCNGASDGIITVTPTGGTELYQYSLDGVTFQASNVFEDLAAGDYTITVEDANGCTATVDATIGEPLVLTASAIATDALCNGSANGTITASAEGGTLAYEYSLDGTTFQPGNLFENLVAGSYTITVRDANLCTVTTTAEVGEPVAITVNATPTHVTCFGEADGIISISVSNGTPGYEYSIDGGTTYQPEDEFTKLAPGTYTITVRDANGCTEETEPVEITEPPLPNATITAVDPLCNDSAPINLTAATPGGTWSGTGIIEANDGTFDPSVAGAGSWVITYEVFVDGCSNTDTETIVVNEPEDATIDPVDPVCSADPEFSLSAATTGGTWSGTGITDANVGTFNPTAAGAGSHTITYTISRNGCTSSDTEVIEVLPSPATPVATYNNPVCEGGTLQLSTPAVTGASYLWTGPNGYTAGVRTPIRLNVTAAHAGTYQVYVTVDGCASAAGTVNVEIGPIPAAPAPTNTGPYCASETIQLRTLAVSGASYSWTGPNGFTSSLRNPDILNATTANAGTYNLTITVNGCPSPSGSTNVIINATPATPVVSNDGPVCEGNTLNLSTTSIADTYEWFGPNGFTSSEQNPIITNVTETHEGSYTLRVSNGGCFSSGATTDVIVNPSPNAPEAENPPQVCVNTTIPELSAIGTTLRWFEDAALTSEVATGETYTPAFDNSVPGNHDFYVTQTIGDCQSVATVVTVSIIDGQPEPPLAQDATYCVGETPVLKATGTAINWYYDSSGDIWAGSGNEFTPPIFDNTVANEFSYYATQTVCGIESSPNEVVLAFISGSPSEAPVATVQDGATCGSFAVSWTDIDEISGYRYDLSDQSDFSTFIQEDISVTASTTTASFSGLTAGMFYYFRVRAENACGAGTNSNTASIQLPSSSPLATTTSPDPLCVNSAVPQLSATGNNIRWYSDAATTELVGSGNFYTPAPPYIDNTVAGSTSFYVTQTNTSCNASTPVEVIITFTDVAQSPVANSPAPLCIDQPVPMLTATGTNLTWYDGADINTATILHDGNNFTPNINNTVAGTTNFYVTQTDECGESLPTEVTVTYIDEPSCNECGGSPIVIGTPVVTDASCVGAEDGSASFTISGGVSGTYTISWGTTPDRTTASETGLAAGTYTVTVADATNALCFATTDVVIDAPVAVVVSLVDQFNPTCADPTSGSAIVSATGGVEPYTYSWNTSPVQNTATATNLPAGTFRATVTDVNGCSGFVDVTIVDPVNFTLDIDPTDVTTCGGNDGAIAIEVSGMNGNMTYSWLKDGITIPETTKDLNSLVAGVYTLTASDDGSGCSRTIDITINQPDLVVTLTQALPASACGTSDGRIEVSVTGGSGGPEDYSYTWTNSDGFIEVTAINFIENLPGGTYSVGVLGDCSGTLTGIVILAPVTFTASPTTTAQSDCVIENGSIAVGEVNGGSGNFSFHFLGQGRDVTNTTGSLSDLPAGDYTVTITDLVDNCSAEYPVTIAAPTNCGGGGGPQNCGSFAFNFTFEHPDCGEDNGVVTFLNPLYNGAPASFRYRIRKVGDAVYTDQPNNNVFITRSAGDYEYVIINMANSDYCDGTFRLDPKTSVTASASNFEDVTCFGEPTGKARIDASGSSTGEYYYSVDNGTIWNPFTPGNMVSNLPPNGTYNILVGESENDNCPAIVPVIINNLNTQIQFTYTATESSCSGKEGSVTITSVSGGTGSYQISFNGGVFENFGGSRLYPDLSRGAKSVRIQDASGCILSGEAIVPSPNQVVVNVTKIADPSCSGDGRDGRIQIMVDRMATLVAPPYEFGISREMDEESITLHPLNRDVNDNYTAYIDTLSFGTYYVYVIATDNSCGSWEEVRINNGPVSMDFDLIDINNGACKGDYGSVTLTNVRRDPAVLFTVQIFKDGVTDPIYERDFANMSSAGYRIGYPEVELARGNYQILVSQNQAICGAPMKSQLKDFSIIEPLENLSSRIKETRISLPDQPTGSIFIDKIRGGTTPYQAKVTLRSDGKINDDHEIDLEWTSVNINTAIMEYEIRFDNLYPGIYDVFIQDDNGCEMVHEVVLDYDRSLVIPNVFTPNGDNKNETFVIRNLPETGSRLLVTNKWGKMVYQATDYKNDWDGGELPEGIYFYTLVVPSGSKYNGWVEIWKGPKY